MGSAVTEALYLKGEISHRHCISARFFHVQKLNSIRGGISVILHIEYCTRSRGNPAAELFTILIAIIVEDNVHGDVSNFITDL